MSTQPFDPAQYKAAQRQEWDAAAAGWKKWWKTIEHGAQHISDRMVELAELQPGHRVLDIATGIGEPALTAARRVGPVGRITATDQSPQMLAIARERAASAWLQNIDFHEMDAESLSFPEDSFDAVLCRWGLMFMPDLAGALERVHRALTPGGKFVATVWAEPARVPMAALAMGVLQKMFEVPPPPPGAPSLFALAPPGVLEQAVTKAGFRDVRSEELTMSLELASSESYVELMQDIAAPIKTLIAGQAGERAGEVWQAIAVAAEQFAGPDGVLKIPNVALCVTGTR